MNNPAISVSQAPEYPNPLARAEALEAEITDPENEKDLLDLARHATAAQVEKLVRAYRGVERHAQREHATKQHAARELNYYYDEDGAS